MKLVSLVSAAALSMLLGCAAPQSPVARAVSEPAPAGNIVEGQRLAEIYCARCHAIGAEGESTHPMSPPFRTLSHHYPVGALEEAFAEGVLVGHPDMPEFRLEPEQIDDLLSYIQSVQERRGG